MCTINGMIFRAPPCIWYESRFAILALSRRHRRWDSEWRIVFRERYLQQHKQYEMWYLQV